MSPLHNLTEVIHLMRAMPEEARVRNLRTLRLLVDEYPDSEWAAHKRWLANRIDLRRRIKECAEDGRVAVIEAGMDCDGVQYSGKVTLIDATFEAFLAHEDHVAKWADGPFGLGVMRPSAAESICYRSRDRALEAFEDGHDHVLHMGDLG